MVLLPGLVAAGAGLLFGVNAFCLDGSGALWLSSLPHPPQLAFWAKTRVLLEVCSTAVVVALLAGGLRSGALPTPTELATAVGAATACCLSVTASCMGLSVRSPHRADLQGSRDTPAPPATMAAYSVRLATLTTLTGIAFSLTAYAGSPWLAARAHGRARRCWPPAACSSRPACTTVPRSARGWRRPWPPADRARVRAVWAAG